MQSQQPDPLANASLESIVNLENFEKLSALVPPSVIEMLLAEKRHKHPNYPSGSVIIGRQALTDFLVKLNLTKNQRQQIIYYTGPNSHAYAFDIAVVDGKLSIYCYEPANISDQSSLLPLIRKELDNRNIPFTLYATQAQVQADGNNCAFLSYIALMQLAKINDLHAKLPDLAVKIDSAPQDEYGIEAFYYNSRYASWISLEALPEKISASGQQLGPLYKKIKAEGEKNNLSKEAIRTLKRETADQLAKKYPSSSGGGYDYPFARHKNKIAKLMGKNPNTQDLIKTLIMARENKARQENPLVELLIKSRRNNEEPLTLTEVLSALKIIGDPAKQFALLKEAAEFVAFDLPLYQTKLSTPLVLTAAQIRDMAIIRQALILIAKNNPIPTAILAEPCTLLDRPFREMLDTESRLKLPNGETTHSFRDLINALQQGGRLSAQGENTKNRLMLLRELSSRELQELARLSSGRYLYSVMGKHILELFALLPAEAQKNLLELLLNPGKASQLLPSLRSILNDYDFQDLERRVKDLAAITRLPQTTPLPAARDLIAAVLQKEFIQKNPAAFLDKLKSIKPLGAYELDSLLQKAKTAETPEEKRTNANLFMRHHLLNFLRGNETILFTADFLAFAKEAAKGRMPQAIQINLLCACQLSPLSLQEKQMYLQRIPSSNPQLIEFLKANPDFAKTLPKTWSKTTPQEANQQSDSLAGNSRKTRHEINKVQITQLKATLFTEKPLGLQKEEDKPIPKNRS